MKYLYYFVFFLATFIILHFFMRNPIQRENFFQEITKPDCSCSTQVLSSEWIKVNQQITDQEKQIKNIQQRLIPLEQGYKEMEKAYNSKN